MSRQKQQYQQNRQQSRAVNEAPKPKILYTCWKCHLQWDSDKPLQQDKVECPYCKSIHGQITSNL